MHMKLNQIIVQRVHELYLLFSIINSFINIKPFVHILFAIVEATVAM